MKILLVSSGGPENSVFESQVLGMARAWRKYGETGFLYRSNQKQDVSIEQVDVIRFNKLPDVARLLLNIERLYNGWNKKVEQYDLIHCRGPISAWMVLKSLKKKQRNKVKVCYDCRGVVVEETAGYWGTGWKKFILPLKNYELRQMENLAVKNSDFITAVSEPLSKYLKTHYGRSADLIIRPVVDGKQFNFSETKRNEIRNALDMGINDRLFLFVGGTSYWQSLDLLKEWWHLNGTNNVLMVLTHNPKQMAEQWQLTEKQGVGKMIVKSVPHKEVAAYMSAADFGILFRDNILVNRVASPVKLSEYLCAGLPVLTNIQQYQEIQPRDIIIINPKSILKTNEINVRDINKRLACSLENVEVFNSNYAAERITSLYTQ